MFQKTNKFQNKNKLQNKMWQDYLNRGSSPVDWCEKNYTITPYIAEFWNTISNVFLIMIPPLFIHLHKPYANYIGKYIQWHIP